MCMATAPGAGAGFGDERRWVRGQAAAGNPDWRRLEGRECAVILKRLSQSAYYGLGRPLRGVREKHPDFAGRERARGVERPKMPADLTDPDVVQLRRRAGDIGPDDQHRGVRLGALRCRHVLIDRRRTKSLHVE